MTNDFINANCIPLNHLLFVELVVPARMYLAVASMCCCWLPDSEGWSLFAVVPLYDGGECYGHAAAAADHRTMKKHADC